MKTPLETKEFKIVRNILWPVKSTIVISDAGINNNGKIVNWDEIDRFTLCHNRINNSADQYLVEYWKKDGKRSYMSVVVGILAKRKKKDAGRGIFLALQQGFDEKLIKPRLEKLIAEHTSGNVFELAGCKISPEDLRFVKGLISKEGVILPWIDVRLTYPDGVGGIQIYSEKKSSDKIIVQTSHQEYRYLAAFLEWKLGAIKS